MTENRKNITFIMEKLEELYPLADCTLEYDKAYELLISTRLAAQCTDARVNMITPALFERYPTLEAFAEAEVEDVEEMVKSCGLYHSKARDIVACARMLVDEYDGQVPDTVDELVKLPGVGRKIANLIVGDIFKKPAIVTDTHCIRITNKLGLVNSKDPYKVEMQLREFVPPEKGSDFCHRLVMFGREICIARRPQCGKCPLRDICPGREDEN